MKATITNKGVLEIKAENALEEYAISQWLHQNCNEDMHLKNWKIYYGTYAHQTLEESKPNTKQK